MFSWRSSRQVTSIVQLCLRVNVHGKQRLCSTKSFLPITEGSDFPLQNLPYGVFSTNSKPEKRIGVAIGDYVLDVSQVTHFFKGPVLSRHRDVFKETTLNSFMALGTAAWREARVTLQKILSADSYLLRDDTELKSKCLIPQDLCTMHLPAEIGDFTDFHASHSHATTMGALFHEHEPTTWPNWFHMPVAYHGRCSSIVPSGTPVRRPTGQMRPDREKYPIFGPTRELDFELEMAFFVGPGTSLGERVPISEAHKYIFGMVLLCDWSARDFHAWENEPFGPFTGKNFATSISPWVVTMEALQPFVKANPRQKPTPLPYLQHSDPYSFDVNLEVTLKADDIPRPATICKTNLTNMYWTPKQQIAHHSVSGCNLRPGDLMAVGTVSGEPPHTPGSLIGLTDEGDRPVNVGGGRQRYWLEDGDQVALSGFCQGDGFRVGFGKCEGKILPALKHS